VGNAFAGDFNKLTGNFPFPWQSDLYDRLCSGKVPRACVIPTGLGKTSVIPIWFLARITNLTLPRRLVYVVNRRTVVDQTTDEVTKLRHNLPKIGLSVDDLAISTLRGQFADNREWSADPSRAAVICGTVDMIGSRLLFSGYGVGFKGKPLHAGFLGQDVLLVHDEAHLEEPFQKLATSIEQVQSGSNAERVVPPLRVMALTATPRAAPDPLRITDADRKAAAERLDGVKRLILVPAATDADAVSTIVDYAHALLAKDRAVLIFVRTVEGVKKIVDGLKKKRVPEDHIDELTGTIRGKERDELVERPVFRRFLPNPDSDITGTVYLVCTSAGEVGVNISADDLVCDLSPFDSMAQRFGRVNRFGKRKGKQGSTVNVVHPTEFDPKKPLEDRREKTLKLLERLQSVNPNALETLPQGDRERAFTPTPECLPLTDILIDAWSLTSIRTRMPGRPQVEPYLHGIAEYQEPETRVAWRKEVEVIPSEMFDDHPPRDLLEAYELRPHELLRDTSRRVFAALKTLAERFGDRQVWLLDEFGGVETHYRLQALTARDEAPIRNQTVLLPHDVGGLNPHGMLDGNAQPADDPDSPISNDVADQMFGHDGLHLRVRVDDRNDSRAKGMRLIRTIRWPKAEDSDDTDAEPRVWYWFEQPTTRENSRHALEPVTLDGHVGDVERRLDDILGRLSLDPRIAAALKLAAHWHDLGKRRERWQASIGRPDDLHETWFAKSGRVWVSRREGSYRHEFGSLLDVTRLEVCAEFHSLDPAAQDLVLHVIASHHGMARPHFEADQTLDDNHPPEAAEAMTVEVLRRFARLQRRFGHWGLAYVESLLRAADWHASVSPSQFFIQVGR
jgi:CRISPR-associated endonuclease/helicase Cas3